ncbi:MAG TPA: hypothetical protein VF145_11015 [Chitinophagaceae bacterium]
MQLENRYDYVVTLKSERRTIALDYISHLLMLLVVAVTLYHLIQLFILRQNVAASFGSDVAGPPIDQPKLIVILTFIALLGLWVYGARKKRFRYGFWLAALMWFVVFEQVLPGGILYLIAGLLEQPMRQATEIGFSKDGIRINTFPSKAYHWKELSNVVIKDGILTLDFRNNKILQREIEPPADSETELEFNGFCRQFLQPAGN